MSRKKAIFIVVLALALLLIILPSKAFDSNDYGGDSGGWDSGSDWSWDSDSDWGDGGSSPASVGSIIIIIIIVVIVMAIKNKIKPAAGVTRPSSGQGLHIQLPDRTVQIEGIIKSHDPNFSASDFVAFVKRMYIDIQTAWCKRDLTPVRVFLHDNLYDATVRQIQAKIDQGVIYHYESMVVNTAYLTSYAKDEQYEYATLYLNARMIDWQEDEKTGKILRGDKTTRWDLRYIMKFMRSVDVVTRVEAEGETGVNCPNCGAPLEMASSVHCVYCDAVVTTGKYNWVLSDFGTIRNDTVDEGIRGV